MPTHFIPLYSRLHYTFADSMVKSYLDVYVQQLDDTRAVLQIDLLWNNLLPDEQSAWVRSIALKSADTIVA